MKVHIQFLLAKQIVGHLAGAGARLKMERLQNTADSKAAADFLVSLCTYSIYKSAVTRILSPWFSAIFGMDIF